MNVSFKKHSFSGHSSVNFRKLSSDNKHMTQKALLLNVFELSGERYFCHPAFRETFKALETMATATVGASTSKT